MKTQTTKETQRAVKVVNKFESSVLLRGEGGLFWCKYDGKIDNREFGTTQEWKIWWDGERFSGRPLTAKELIEKDKL